MAHDSNKPADDFSAFYESIGGFISPFVRPPTRPGENARFDAQMRKDAERYAKSHPEIFPT